MIKIKSFSQAAAPFLLKCWKSSIYLIVFIKEQLDDAVPFFLHYRGTQAFSSESTAAVMELSTASLCFFSQEANQHQSDWQPANGPSTTAVKGVSVNGGYEAPGGEKTTLTFVFRISNLFSDSQAHGEAMQERETWGCFYLEWW